jgi:hypothetical protein
MWVADDLVVLNWLRSEVMILEKMTREACYVHEPREPPDLTALS